MTFTHSYFQKNGAQFYRDKEKRDERDSTVSSFDDFHEYRNRVNAWDRFFQTPAMERLLGLGGDFKCRNYDNFMKASLTFEALCEEEVMEVVRMAVLPQYSGLWNAGPRVFQRTDIFKKHAELRIPLCWLVDGFDFLTTPTLDLFVPKMMVFRLDQFAVEHKLCYGKKQQNGAWEFSTKYGEKVRCGQLWLTDDRVPAASRDESRRLCVEMGFSPTTTKKGDLLEPLFRKLDESEAECMFRIDGRAVMRKMNAGAE